MGSPSRQASVVLRGSSWLGVYRHPLWLGRQGYKGEGTPPPLSDDIVTEVSARYISAYERLTGLDFIPGEQPPESRIEARLAAYFGVQ